MSTGNDSYLIRQERCPKCAAEGNDRSANNLAVYSDGHSYCYGGHGLLEKGSKLFTFKHRDEPELDKNLVVLPPDCDIDYPQRCVDWVGQYELTKTDLLTNNVLWSERMQRLIFPIYDLEKGLIAWQGRWFGSGTHTKWFGRGNLKDTFNFLGSGDRLVLTEDIVSSMKLAKCGVIAMPLYGCVVGADRFKRLRYLRGPSRVDIWLDPDKRKEAVKEVHLGWMYGLKCHPIFSDHDPKEHSYEELKNILT
jgi:hypothetical protein